MRIGIIFALLTVQILSLLCFAQTDDRPVVGVESFKSEVPTNYGKAITEKVIETLVNSKRFRVVDRTNLADIDSEKKIQRSEDYINSNGNANQDSALPPNFLVQGQIRQINISEMMNVDGSIGGYKASLSFTLQIVDIASQATSQAQSFESKGADQALTQKDQLMRRFEQLDQNLKAISQTIFQ